jgi:hypothetical protein
MVPPGRTRRTVPDAPGRASTAGSRDVDKCAVDLALADEAFDGEFVVCSACGRTDLPPAGDWDPPVCAECDAALNFDAIQEAEYFDHH